MRRVTVVDEHVEQRGEFARIVNPLAQPNGRPIHCVFRNGSESKWSVGLRRVVQLNIPYVINGSSATCRGQDSILERPPPWPNRTASRLFGTKIKQFYSRPRRQRCQFDPDRAFPCPIRTWQSPNENRTPGQMSAVRPLPPAASRPPAGLSRKR